MKDAELRPFALALALVSFASGKPAWSQQQCDTEAAVSELSTAAIAIGAWERERGITLTEEARLSILSELCEAGLALARDAGLAQAEIERASGSAVVVYLDESASSSRETQSLSNLLAAQFSLNAGPRIPMPRALGRIEISYRRPIDGLVVAGQSLAAHPVLMSRLGTIAIAGFAGQVEVCRGSVNVTLGAAAHFTC